VDTGRHRTVRSARGLPGCRRNYRQRGIGARRGIARCFYSRCVIGPELGVGAQSRLIERGGWVKADDVAGSPDGRILCAHGRDRQCRHRCVRLAVKGQGLAVAGELRQFCAGPAGGRCELGVAGRAGRRCWWPVADPTLPCRRAGPGPGRRGRRCWRRGRRAAVPHHRPDVAGAITPGGAAGEASLVLAVRPGTMGTRGGGCRPAAGLAQQYVSPAGAKCRFRPAGAAAAAGVGHGRPGSAA
jgi:hypothetical protein